MARPGDLYGPPIRDASVRGGAGRFSWEDVKKDEKFRDTYLGHSLKAPVGRWQKGKDLAWYAKAGGSSAQQERSDEIAMIKAAEEEALAEALGFKVAKRVVGVSREEVERVLKDEENVAEGEVKGLGFGRYNWFFKWRVNVVRSRLLGQCCLMWWRPRKLLTREWTCKSRLNSRPIKTIPVRETITRDRNTDIDITNIDDMRTKTVTTENVVVPMIHTSRKRPIEETHAKIPIESIPVIAQKSYPVLLEM
jgi:hypothetical protein